MEKSTVFIAGGTGYIGKRLIGILLREGYDVIALVREQSIKKLPDGCKAVIGSPFDSKSYINSIPADCIFIHLVGVSHPGPKKKLLFYSVDLASLKASIEAAKQAGVKHFIYMSVAQYPTKVMADYQEARRQGEETVLASGLTSTFIRPWYVLGPGHYWPILLLPVYGIAELVPSWRKKARAMGLVTIGQMINALVSAVKQPPQPYRILEIKDIRRF